MVKHHLSIKIIIKRERCSKRNSLAYFFVNLSGLEYFEDENTTMPRCQTFQEANAVRQLYYSLAYAFQEAPWKYNCPLPCQRTKYVSTLQYYHSTSWIEVDPDVMKNFGFVFFYFYGTLTVENRVESLVYDFGSLLISIGKIPLKHELGSPR